MPGACGSECNAMRLGVKMFLCPPAGRGVIRTVGEEIDRLETEMKALVPGLR